MYVIIGAAVLPSREGRGLGRGTGLDGRPQWRREATNGRKIVMINLGYDCSNSNLKKKTFRWRGCSTTDLSLPFLTSAPVLLVWTWRDSYTRTVGRSVTICVRMSSYHQLVPFRGLAKAP